MAKLIRTQVPDRNGKTLPMDMTSGSYQIEDVKGPPVGYVFEGKLIIDKKYGHVGYGCMNCCGFSSAFQTLDPLEIIANETNQQRAKAINSCNSGEEDFTSYSYGWYSTNSSVAAVYSGGTVEGGEVGEAEVYGFFDANSFFIVAESCPADQQTTWASIRVRPVIHQITGNGNIPMLNSGYQGRDNQTLSSSVSPTGGTYSWTAISGASKVNLLNATSSSVIVQSVAVGAATIQLQYTYNGISATKTYAVQVRQPTSLSTISNDTSTFDCGANPYNTTKREIRYQVLDGSGQGLNADSMKANELLTTTSNNCNVSNPTEGPTADTSVAGVFGPDQLLMCTAACLPADSNRNPLGSCTVNVTQVWKVNGYTVRTNALSYQCSGPTVTPQ